jgi:Xaa-Pro dipeptidase
MRVVEALRGAVTPAPRAFDDEEYATRLSRVRAAMRRDAIDVLLVSNIANVCYLTGYESVMASGHVIAVVPQDGPLSLQVLEGEAVNAYVYSWVEDVRVCDTYEKDRITHLGRLLQDRGFQASAIGIEADKSTTFATGAMESATLRRLQEMLPSADFVDTTHLVTDVRVVKSEAELEHLRTAGALTARGMDAGLAAVGPGTTTNEVIGAIYAAMLSGGSEVPALQPMVLRGWEASAPHLMAHRQVIQPGDSVYIECSAAYRRYSAPRMRTIAVGEPTPTVRRLADTSLAVLDTLLGTIKAGRTAHEVAVAAKRVLLDGAGDVYWWGSFSYAIGVGFPPYWSEGPMYIQEGSDRVLEAGMALHVNAYLSEPGDAGVGFSESVVVTADGCGLLTPGGERQLIVR